jgi:heterotetrameric sarcosine oxidase gamma subunit
MHGWYFRKAPSSPGSSPPKQKTWQVTDQSDGHFLVRVKGPHAREILAKLVPIDLHESVFAPDAVAITLAAHIGIKIWREEDGFVVACFRSFAAALHHTLLEAANEFHLTETRG